MAGSLHRKTLSVVLWCLVTAVLLTAFGYLCLGNLNAWHIEDYDEARHGVNAYEMTQNGDYLVHTYQGEPDLWNTKPPLSFWLVSIAYRIFGYTPFALRFFAGLSTLLGALAITLLMARRYGKWAVPLVLLMFTANSILYGLHFARFGDADSQYQFFFTLAMLCLLLSFKNFKSLYGCGVFFSLAFLEKSFHALTIPAVCFLTLVFTGRLKELTLKRVLLLLASGLALVLVWAAARISRDGFAFFTNSFELDVASRVGGGVADPAQANMSTWAYNFGVLLGLPYVVGRLSRFFLPCNLVCLSFGAVCTAILLIRKVKLTPFTRYALVACLLWLLVPVLLYSLLGVKFCWYLYSVTMALPALTCILFFAAVRSGFGKRIITAAMCVFAALLIALSTVNILNVATIEFDQTFQAFIAASLDRDLDGGKHAYIIYAENGYTDWMPGDMLTAQLYGDLTCRNGGLAAFEEDGADSLLFIARTNNEELIAELWTKESVFNEDYYCIAFEKF